MEDRIRSTMVVLGNLSTYYGECGNYENCVNICREGIELCLKSGKGGQVPTFLLNVAEALYRDKRIDKAACWQAFQQADYLCDLLQTGNLKKYVKNCMNELEMVVD